MRELEKLGLERRLMVYFSLRCLTRWQPRRGRLRGHSDLYRRRAGGVDLVCHRAGEVVTVLMVQPVKVA